MSDILERETRYVKSAKKVVPTKADHKHEYFRVITFARILRSDGTLTDATYKFSQPTKCVDCGHLNRKAFRNATEIEVSVKEFNKLSGRRLYTGR